MVSATIDIYVYASIQLSESCEPANYDKLLFHTARRLLGLPVDSRHVGRTLSGDLIGSGLGSSSASAVAVLALLNEWHDLALSSADLARLAYRLEREELGQLGGAQDYYAAAFGGLNFIEFGAHGAASVTPLRLRPDTSMTLERSLLLCDSGIRRDSGEVLKRQVGAVQRAEEPSLRALHRIKALAFEMKYRLLGGDLTAFAELMRLAWEEKRQLGGVEHPRLRALLEAGQAAGAMAGRVLGAGNGGFLLFFVAPALRQAVATALVRAGGKPRTVGLVNDGAGPGWRSTA